MRRMGYRDIDRGEYPNTKAEAVATGSRYFYTGRTCAYGHTTVRYTNGGACFNCARRRVTKYNIKKAQQEYPNVRRKIEDLLESRSNK